MDEIVRAKRPQRLPVVLTRDEVRAVLRRLEGTPRLMAFLLYGAGLKLLECCRLRVQDVDFGTNRIVVRSGKGDKDRVTMLPAVVKPHLARHLERVRTQPRGSGASRDRSESPITRTSSLDGTNWLPLGTRGPTSRFSGPGLALLAPAAERRRWADDSDVVISAIVRGELGATTAPVAAF